MPQPGDFASNGKSAEKAAEKMQEKAGDMMAQTRGAVEDMAGTAREKMNDTADAVAEMAERIQRSSVYTTASRTVREQPVATLAGAVAIGFIAGALWKLSRTQTTAERFSDRVSSFAEPHMRSLRRNIWG